MTTASTLTKSQKKTFASHVFKEHGKNFLVEAEVRFDDECGNGHNSFAITGTKYLCDVNGGKVRWESGGCIHEEIAKHLPELEPLIKWHLCDTNGPLHYVANSLYWAGGTKYTKANIEHFRSTAIWPDATQHDMDNPQLKQILQARLPALMAEFRAAVEGAGFAW